MYNSSMDITLDAALRADSSTQIAFTGAGGKSIAMFQLARFLGKAQRGTRVILTATSHLGAWQTDSADRHIIAGSLSALEVLNQGTKGVILVTGELDGDRTRPLEDPSLDWLHAYCQRHHVPLLVEADGSRQKPLKGWAKHEPPVPSFAEHVVQVAGLGGLGKPLINEYVHRAEIFSRLGEIGMGELMTAEVLTRVLSHRDGGLKNIPPGARRSLILNQADTPELQAAAQSMAGSLLGHFHAVVISSLLQENIFAVHERTAGIILAAGESTRFGQAKQLLDWRGQPFVRTVARTALDAGLSPVIVVTGASAEKVESVLGDLDTIIVRNTDWESGQGSSIREGIKRLLQPDSSPWTGAVIFLLADQPQVTTSVIRALVEKHAEGLHPIVAPMVIDQRANPVLFDRVTFPDLMNLEGDVGGRAIFHLHRVEYLPWQDDRLLLDVDTPEMYLRLIADETL